MASLIGSDPDRTGARIRSFEQTFLISEPLDPLRCQALQADPEPLATLQQCDAQEGKAAGDAWAATPIHPFVWLLHGRHRWRTTAARQCQPSP